MKIDTAKAVRVTMVLIILVVWSGGCARLSKAPEPEPAAPEQGPAEEVAAPVQAEPEPVPEEVPPPQPEEPSYYVHTVQWPGESLSIIAFWYTGNAENWRALARANPELNPSRIFLGNTIRIPLDLMKTQDPMPPEFVERFLPKAKETEPSPEPQVEEESDVELFQPKK